MPDAQPIYSESLTAYFRFGGHPIFALTGNDFRYVRGVEEELVALKPPGDDASGAESAEAGRLRTSLDRLLGPNRIDAPAPPAAGDEDRFALLGYLHSTPLRPDTDDGLTANEEGELVEAHREAAVLVGQKKYSAAVRALQAIVAERPMLAAVHFQLGELLERTGRLDEAIQSFRTVRELRPDSTRPALALVDVLLRAGQIERAAEEASLAVALAEREDMHVLASAHGMAARVESWVTGRTLRPPCACAGRRTHPPCRCCFRTAKLEKAIPRSGSKRSTALTSHLTPLSEYTDGDGGVVREAVIERSCRWRIG